MKYDRQNVDVYLGLDQAMEKAGQSATERAQALESFPDMPSAPAALVFRLVEVLSEAQEFDQAEKLLEHRFFPREEGGTTVAATYVAVRLKHAAARAAQHDCAGALEIVHALEQVPFTTEKMAPYTASDPSRHAIEQIQSVCR